MKCPRCNEKDHEDIARYCHICGTPLINDNSKTVFGEGTSKFVPLIKQANSSDINMAIDLGLPSGTRWAPCNVGATMPHERGDFFAWGEIEKKEKYTWNTYSHCEKGNHRLCHNIGFGSIMWGSKYDVAHMNWGGMWRMPTRAQFMELIDNCTYDWAEIDHVRGYIFISKINGNSIFLPAAGMIKDTDNYDDFQGFYWSCEYDPNNSSNAISLCFSGSIVDFVHCYRKNGLPVRPVL